MATMTIYTLTEAKPSRFNSTKLVYEGEDTLVATAAASTVAIPVFSGDITNIVYSLLGTGVGKVQATIDDHTEIIAGTATWVDLVDGAYVNPAVTALRQFNTSGTTVLKVRMQ